VKRGGQRVCVPLTKRMQQRIGHLRCPDLLSLTQRVALSVDRRRRQTLVRQSEHPVELSPTQHRHDLLAATSTDGVRAEQRERHIRSESGTDVGELLPRQPGPPQRIAGNECSRRIGASARHSPG